MLMLLFHGQATVARGFLFNKEIMTHNMKERMVVALRAVVDLVTLVGGLDKMTITKKMLLAAGSAKHPTAIIWQKRKSRIPRPRKPRRGRLCWMS
jgi:hypothetical protein